jgi:Uma2 family endonuclease
VVDPDDRTVTVYRKAGEGRLLWEDATITGEDVLPGFECRVAEFFAE